MNKSVEKTVEKKGEFGPMHAAHPDPGTTQCSACKLRDKTELKFPSGNKVAVGAIRAFCDKHKKPPKSNGKPHDVLCNVMKCDLYEMEEDA